MTCGKHVIISQMGIVAFQSKLRQQVLELILSHARNGQLDEFERIKYFPTANIEMNLRKITPEIMVKNGQIELNIMPHQDSITDEIDETLQCLHMGVEMVSSQFIDDGIVYIPKFQGYLPVGGDVHVEMFVFHDLSPTHLDGSNLDDVVFHHVQARRLSIKDDNFIVVIRTAELLQIGAPVIKQ